jgi:GTP-binding protein LepA
MDSKFIRNFSIIAHIDHGKSTLADRLLEFTKTIAKREMMNQIMDSMDLERERGITIKLNTARMNYTAKDGQEYIVNLIDTPGHVDFTYEVSRSLAACEGVLLIVDASQGIEAQTLANTYLAMEHNLVIIPVINKIDLPGANLPKVRAEIENVIGIPASEAIEISAKEGINIDQVMEAIVKRIPPPSGKPDAKLQALIFDSYYDEFRGVITKVCIKNGTVKKGDKVRMMATGNDFELSELGHLKVKMFPCDSMSVGEVGYLVANIRSVDDSRVGDTVTLAYDPAPEPLPVQKSLTLLRRSS